MGEDAAILDPARPELARGTAIGRHVVVDVLGRGGMGVVYLAYDPELDRRLAIKLLRAPTRRDHMGGALAGEGRQRLLREAQAMARLAHPNVVAVFDVGLFEDEVFVAMEYVAGTTLKAWLAEKPRGWRAVLDVFLQAGRGLAAAHAASIVHRDFKPENVLIDETGRARVVDFGLARGDTEPLVDVDDVEAQRSLGGTSPPLTATLTRTGSFLGTPAYMAPEQLAGEAIDGRADQFAYCVALYEAMYGERPFADATIDELMLAISRGDVREPRAGRAVPAWLRKATVRGLAAKADDRYPSMEKLLTELDRDPARARWRVVAGAGAVALIAVAAVVGPAIRHDGAAKPCADLGRELAGTWDGARAESVRTAFRATTLPFADDMFTGVQRELDGYANHWTGMRIEACEATHVRGVQSEARLDLRMSCLDRRKDALRAHVELFITADPALVARAVQAASTLPPIDDCADVAALEAPVPPPSEPAARARLDGVNKRLAAVQALKDAGRYADGLREALVMAAEAKAIGYRPTIAEALLLTADLQDRTGDAKASVATVDEALVAAEASHADNTAAQIWLQRIWLAGFRLADLEQARAWTPHARAAVERAGSPDRLIAKLDDKLGLLAYRAGDYAAAIELGERALAAGAKAFGPEDVELGPIVNNLAIAYWAHGSYDDALAAYRRALSIFEKALGGDHPLIATCLNNVGMVERQLGNTRDALPLHRRALAIQEKLGAESSDVATSHENISLALRDQGDLAGATAEQEQVVAIRKRALGPEHPDVGTALVNLADLHRLAGQLEAAGGEYVEALAIWETALGKDHPNLAYALTGQGEIALAQRHRSSAVAPLERALALREKTPGDPIELAHTQFALARAITDRGRARTLAQAAAAGFEAGGDRTAKDLAEVRAFLAMP